MCACCGIPFLTTFAFLRWCVATSLLFVSATHQRLLNVTRTHLSIRSAFLIWLLDWLVSQLTLVYALLSRMVVRDLSKYVHEVHVKACLTSDSCSTISNARKRLSELTEVRRGSDWRAT
jgi:hypothetical protein